MAVCTVRGELLSDVIGIGGGVIVIGVTTRTGVGCIVVVAVVACTTVVRDRRVCPDQLIEVIVNGESGWRPSGICCVACFAGGGQIQRYVTWICALYSHRYGNLRMLSECCCSCPGDSRYMQLLCARP